MQQRPKQSNDMARRSKKKRAIRRVILNKENRRSPSIAPHHMQGMPHFVHNSGLIVQWAGDSIELMPTEHILTLLITERDRLTRAIEVLQGGTTTKRRGRPPGSKNGVSITPAAPQRQGRRTFTAAARKAQSRRMKAYWVAKKKVSK